MFEIKKRKKWPKIDTCSEVQQFIDRMCELYDVPQIKVIVKSKRWVEWFAGLGVSACAFWPNEGEWMQILGDISSSMDKLVESQKKIGTQLK